MADLNGTVSTISSVANNGFLTIQPSAGQELMIVNIYAAGAAEVYKTDGTNDVLIDSNSAQSSWMNFKFFLTNTQYIKVKNISGGTALLGYDGIRIV